MSTAELKASLLSTAAQLQVQAAHWRRATDPGALAYLDETLEALRIRLATHLHAMRGRR